MSHFSNVFLIVIDSLRFDHLDCSGYLREISPDETLFHYKSDPQKVSFDEYLLNQLKGLGYIE